MPSNLIVLDAFAGYNTATAGMFWNLQAPVISPTAGRVGPGATSEGERSFALQSTICSGIAYKILANWPTTSICEFHNRRTGAYAKLVPTTDGRVYVRYTYETYGNPPVLQSASSAPFFTLDEWFYYEFKCIHSLVNVGGTNYSRLTFEVHINEGPILSGQLNSTYIPAEYGFASLLVPIGLGANYCDLYITDGEYLGDVKNYIIKPDGDSTPSQWTPTSGSDHYAMVDDAAPDGVTTTLSSPSAGEQDMVTLEDISLVGLIRGIQCNFIGKKTDAGVSSFRSEYNIDGTAYEVPIDKYLSYESFLNFPDCFRKNPVTGNDFTSAEINTLIMGVKRIA